MFKLAWKNLWQERGRFFITAGSISAVVFLILALQGILNGATVGATEYIDNLTSDIVVMQDGVSNMHMAASFLPQEIVSQINGIEGVDKAEGILYVPGFARVPEERRILGKIFGYFSGIEPDAVDVGPLEIIEGRNVVQGKEIVIDKNILRFHNLELGDTISLLDKDLTIVGVATQSGPLLNPVMFVPKDELAAITKSQGLVSYVFVWSGENITTEELMARIAERFKDDVNVMTLTDLAKSDHKMIGKMSSDLVKIIVYVTLLVGIVVIMLMLYTLTLSKIRDYGIIKAIGGDEKVLMTIAVFQGLILSLIGLIFGIVLALGAFPLIEYLSPGIGAFMTMKDVITIFVQFIFVGMLSAVLPIVKIRKADPMIVFKA